MRTIVFVLLLAALVYADVAPLVDTDGPYVIPGSYIVILKDNLTLSARDAHISDLKDTIMSTKADASIGFVYGFGTFIGFSARLSEDLLKSQLAHPNVKYIAADQTVSINYEVEKHERSPLETITQNGATWGIARIGQRDLPLNSYYAYPDKCGAGTDIYIIDTGILTTHTDFGGRARYGANFVTGESNADLNGHGTHCAGTAAGTVYGVAKYANLIAVKVLNAQGSGTTAGVVAGVDWVTNNHVPETPSIGSMSLGGGASQVLDDSVTKSISAGVPYAIAAGNNNANACGYSPARVPTAVTVGATDNRDYRSSFSNYGSCVTCFGPGTSITSDWIGSNTATNTISGTSMATPHIAGIMAVFLGRSTTINDPAAAKSHLTSTGTPGLIQNVGTGSPNIIAYSDPDPK